MSDFEKYKLDKMTKVKFVESKNQIDKEIDRLEEKIKLSSNETEVVTDNELTRELMEKYVESVICEGNIVQNHMEINARGSEKSLSFCCLKIDNKFCVSRLTREGSATTAQTVLEPVSYTHLTLPTN